MMNAVMRRPLFRQSGSPMTGENSSEQAFMQYLQANLSPEQLQALMQNPERDQIIGQLYQKFMSEQQTPSSPMVMRQEGSPNIGERSAGLRSIIEDIRANEGMRNIIGNQEADNVSRQLGNLMRQPFEEFKGKYVRNPMSGEMEPMSGPLTGTPIEQKESSIMSNMGQFKIKSTGETTILEMTPEIYERVKSGELEFIQQLPTRAPMGEPSTLDKIINSLKFAEGGPVEDDAVGIASGLDEEESMEQGPMTVDREPSEEGIAKVSPEQYVQLINEIRGDEVPLEGRVQELAMTVGEQDAQATPLSVLALVQPVFELQEQQATQQQEGIANTPQGQEMMMQGPMPPMAMNSGGIVHLADGPDARGIYEGMNVGPFSLDQIKNFGLYTKPDMATLGEYAYSTGAGDYAESGSPETILKNIMALQTTPKTFAEILKEKQDMISGLGLYDSSKEALALPFYSGLTKFGLDVAKGENIADSALSRWNEATSVAIPSALQIKQQEKQLPLTLAMSEYSSQKDTAKELQKFILDKSFDLAIEREKKGGIGVVGIAGQNNAAIDSVFGEGVADSLEDGTIVQKSSTGTMTTINPNTYNLKNMVTVKGFYLDANQNRIPVSTVIDLTKAEGKKEFDLLKNYSSMSGAQLSFSPFIDSSINFNPTILTGAEDEIAPKKDGGLIVKRGTGTGPDGENSLASKYPEIMSNEAFEALGVNPFSPEEGDLDVTKFKGTDAIIAYRHNLANDTLQAIEDLVKQTWVAPETVGVLGGALRGLQNLTTTADEVMSQLGGFGLPESFVYRNPDLQKTVENMQKIPKLIAEVEAGVSRYQATPSNIEDISKGLNYGTFSSAETIRNALMEKYKSVWERQQTYRNQLNQGTLNYKEPEIFNQEYGKKLNPKKKLDFNVNDINSILLDAVGETKLSKYPDLVKDPIFIGAINAIKEGKDPIQVRTKFLELLYEKYGTGE
jgi:hypothetical protein